ncbi:MAG: hypothetical protein ACRDH7_03265 [Actinomycetota bacterium]
MLDDRIVSRERFDVRAFAEELGAAPDNREVGTTRLFENDRVRVWEVRLSPGERCTFHAHVCQYFWTSVTSGTGRQRSGDGSDIVRRYEEGDTLFSSSTPSAPLIHDLENVGETELRFVTVELIDEHTNG